MASLRWLLLAVVALACSSEDATPSQNEPSTTNDGLPVLVASQPADGAANVGLRVGLRFQFDQPLADPDQARAVVHSSGVAGVPVAQGSSFSIDLTRQNVSFVLDEPLEPSAEFGLELSGLRSSDGRAVDPVTISFTTGVTTLTTGAGQRFAKSKVGEVPGVTGVVFGPEGNVYVTTLHGELIRFPAVSTGDGLALGEPETMVANPDMQFIALAFEPGQQDTVWISQWRNDPVDAFSSEVASYRIGGGVESEVKKLVGLPRHPVGNHSVQGLPFADGKLYVSVGGMTTNGDSSFDFWGEPILRESPISASIVEVDVPSITEPLDTARFAITDNSSPIRLFATGLRNAFGLSRHSNGNLYANINQNGGTDDRNAAAPTDGPCRGLPAAIESQLIPDTFNLIRRGRYYGHPNPSRAECVVMGGGTGPFAVGGYQPGRAADPDFDESLIAFYTGATGGGFGTSVNGIDEYRGPGPLQGTLLSADFSGSRAVLVVRLGDDASRLTIDGPIQQLHDREGQVLTFLHPIDVATAVDGSVVVADFGEWSGDRIGTRGALYALSPIDD